MSTLVIGDVHLSAIWDGVDRTPDIIDILYNQVNPVIKAKKPDTIIWLGDIFHSGSIPHHVIVQFIEYLRSIKVLTGWYDPKHIVLKGNHDGEPKSSKGSPLQILQSVGLVNVIWEWTPYDNVLYIPYCAQEDLDQVVKSGYFKDRQYDLCFTHVDIPGCIPGAETSISRGAPCILPQEIINSCKTVISGHIHEPQELGNIKILGSITRTSISEKKHKRLLFIDNGTFEEIPIVDRDFVEIEVNYKTSAEVESVYKSLEAMDLKGKIVSAKITCPSTIAHEVNFKAIESMLRWKSYHVRFDSHIYKEKEYRIKELDSKMSVWDITKTFVERQGISDKEAVLEDIRTQVLKE